MKVLPVALLLLLTIVFVESITLVIKKNRRYNNPPFCFAYTREYDSNDVSSSCTGYQYDCLQITSTVQIGDLVKFDLSVCPNTNKFREFSNHDFAERLAESALDTTEGTTIGEN